MLFGVHPTPDQLPPEREIGATPTHRYDDPGEQQTYRVRYLATTLHGCLLEVLAQFRASNTATQAALAAVTGVDDEPGGAPAPAETNRRGLQPYLDKLRVGRAQLLEHHRELPSVHDVDLLAWLDQQTEVRKVLAQWPAELGGGPGMHLTEGGVRGDAPLGYELCQAISGLLQQHPAQPAGLHYRSRHSDDEDCWVLYDRSRITFTDIQHLSPEEPSHARAVRRVAHRWGLTLPADRLQDPRHGPTGGWLIKCAGPLPDTDRNGKARLVGVVLRRRPGRGAGRRSGG